MKVQSGLATKALHEGEAPDAIFGAVSPSIVLSTNFVSEPGTTAFSAIDLRDDDPYFYARWATPTVGALEQKLASLEHGEAALCFASGMAASATLLINRLKSGDHLVLTDVCYAGVAELARDSLPRMGIRVTTVDFSNLDAVRSACRSGATMVWAESPCNPILRLTDLEAVAAIAHASGAEFVVDSTIATPCATLPLKLGADWVVHSLTKYLNGHGDALGGVVIGRKDAIAELRRAGLIHLGGALSPFSAWLIMRGLHTLPLRMQRHAENALAVAQFLEPHPAIARVIYPGLASHPQHDLARRQMRTFSGMLTFQTKSPGPEMAKKLAAKLKLFKNAVSLGKQKSLLFYLGTADLRRSSFTLSPEGLRSFRDFAGDGVFRVSVGLEDPADLVEDLRGALES